MLNEPQAWNLLRAAGRQQKYQQYEFNESVGGLHPFYSDQPGRYVEFCGAPGISASIGVLMNEVMDELLSSTGKIISATLWQIDAAGTNGYDVIAEVTVGDPFNLEHNNSWMNRTFLCSGLTDYSGEGNGARIQLVEWLEALESLAYPNNMGINYSYATSGMLQEFYRYHSELLLAAQQESPNEC